MANDNPGYKPLLQRMMPSSSLYNNEKAPNPEYNSPLASLFQKKKMKFEESEMDGSSGYDEYLSQGSSFEPEVSAREYARGGKGGFNPTDNDSVMQLQKMMGFSEDDQDGILGDQTMTSLRELQGGPAWKGGSKPGIEMSGEGVDEYGDGYSYGEGANTFGPVDMSGEESADAFIKRHDPEYGAQQGYGNSSLDDANDYMDKSEWNKKEFIEDFQEDQDWLKSAMAKTTKRQEDPYTPDEYSEMDRYDEEGNIIGGDDYKGPGSTNMTRFNDLAREMNPNLGRFTEIDRGASQRSANSGVNFPDYRFMQTPKQSRDKLSDLIMKQLSVSRKR